MGIMKVSEHFKWHILAQVAHPQRFNNSLLIKLSLKLSKQCNFFPFLFTYLKKETSKNDIFKHFST